MRFYELSWVLFWDVAELLRNSLILIGLAYIIFGWIKLFPTTEAIASWIPYPMPYFSSLAGENRHNYQPYVSIRHHFLLSFQMALSLASISFLTHMYWSVLYWILKKDPKQITWVFPLVVFSTLVVCPMNSTCFVLPRLLVSSQLREFTTLSLSSPSLCSIIETLSRKYAGPIKGLI